MIERAIAADVPFAWVAADSVYGVGEVEMALRRAGKGYVLGVNSNHYSGPGHSKPPIAGTAEEIARQVDPSRMAAPVGGEGTKGARLHDWVYCELADLDAAEYDDTTNRPVDARPADPPQHRRRGYGLLLDLVPGRNGIEMLVKVEGPSLGD